jgi:hypothetical protein
MVLDADPNGARPASAEVIAYHLEGIEGLDFRQNVLGSPLRLESASRHFLRQKDMTPINQ